MSSSQRLIVEFSTYYLQAAVVTGGRLVAHREFAPEDSAALASFISEHAAGLPLDVAILAPVSGFAAVVGVGEPASVRTASGLLERASALGQAGAMAGVCDVIEGRIPAEGGALDWLLAGIPLDAVNDASRRMTELGLAPAAMAPALPAKLGAVVELVRGTPGSADVVVWEPGESSGRLWRVSSAGIRSVTEVAAGLEQIFGAVQAELGLKFRAAATKLFFNGSYEFGETEDKIAGRLGDLLRGALGEAPPAFHVLGLPAGQAWLGRAVAKSLGSTAWAPVEATAASRYGVAADLLSPSVIGLLQAAVAGWVGDKWLPAWLTPDSVIPAVAKTNPAPGAAPAAVSTPTPAPAPVRAVQPTPPPVVVPPAPTLMRAPVKPAPTAATSKPAKVTHPASVPTPPKPVPPKPAPAKPVAASAPAPAAVPRPPAAQAPVAPAPAPASAPASASGERKFPLVPVIAGVVVLGLVGGGAAFFLKPDAAPASAPAPASVAATEQKAAPAPVVSTPTKVQAIMLEAEVKRDPLGFKNERYQFKVSNKGVLTDFIVAGRSDAWIQNLGFMRLYGVATLPSGRRTTRRAGDMSSSDYQAKVVKRVRDGAVVFDVDVSHPKFLMTQTFVCLPDSLKVEVRFKPLALFDELGPLDAIYSVHMGTADLRSPTSKPLMPAPGELVFNTTQGPLTLRYESGFKGAGKRPVIGDPSLTSFVFAVNGDSTERVLNYEVVLP